MLDAMYYSISDWLIMLLTFVGISDCDYFGYQLNTSVRPSSDALPLMNCTE